MSTKPRTVHRVSSSGQGRESVVATVPQSLGALVGVVAASLGLGVGEVVAGSSRPLQSPIISVGDRFIDFTPAWLKNLAIDVFGTNDKVALLTGIAITLLVYATIVGVLAVRKRLALGIAGIALFGLLGSAAVITGRSSNGVSSLAPTLVGTFFAAAALSALTLFARGGGALGSQSSSRRNFIGALGTTALGAVGLGFLGRGLASRFNVSDERAGLQIPDARSAVTTTGGAVDEVVTETDAVSESAQTPEPPTPVVESLEIDGISDLYTPNDGFYRIDTALEVPQVSIDTWSLTITGLVDQPYSLSYADLLDEDLIETDITLSCVSNEIGGSLLGHAKWVGVRLDALLDRAGIQAGADQIVGRSVDGYTCGFPVSTLDGRDAIVAIAMNGEPLPVIHGYPARLVVPGLYGYVSATKWLAEIELTTFDAFDSYWVPRGWDALAPIKTQSRIDTPRPLASVVSGETVIAGVAWAQTRGISKVEVQIDDQWEEAELAPAINAESWRQWFLPWNATEGRHTLTVRATDGDGVVQTEERAAPMPNGASGWHQTVVIVKP